MKIFHLVFVNDASGPEDHGIFTSMEKIDEHLVSCKVVWNKIECVVGPQSELGMFDYLVEAIDDGAFKPLAVYLEKNSPAGEQCWAVLEYEIQ